MRQINIAKDFTEFPGARYKTDGEYSGEEFFESFLSKYYEENRQEKIEIDLDGTYGYPSSFLSEAFGRFYKEYGSQAWDKLVFISREDPSLIKFINYLAEKYE